MRWRRGRSPRLRGRGEIDGDTEGYARVRTVVRLVVADRRRGVAESHVTSKELNEEEIIAAGIDPSNPANQNVYEFEIKLVFTPSSPEASLHGYVNSGGEFVGSYGGSGGGGGGLSCSPTGCE